MIQVNSGTECGIGVKESELVDNLKSFKDISGVVNERVESKKGFLFCLASRRIKRDKDFTIAIAKHSSLSNFDQHY